MNRRIKVVSALAIVALAPARAVAAEPPITRPTRPSSSASTPFRVVEGLVRRRVQRDAALSRSVARPAAQGRAQKYDDSTAAKVPGTATCSANASAHVANADGRGQGTFNSGCAKLETGFNAARTAHADGVARQHQRGSDQDVGQS
jgi:hypothetical protein